MTAGRVIWRSLVYFRAAHGALLGGMVLVTAVLTGALILGDSVRDSLRELSVRRRGGYEEVVMGAGFFGEGLAGRAGEIAGRAYDAGLALPGRVRAEGTGVSAGVELVAVPKAAKVPGGGAWITRRVAEALEVGVGDAVVVTLPAAGGEGGGADAVLARRDRTSLGALRVTVGRVVDERTRDKEEAFWAWFDVHPSQRAPANVWLNMGDLQEAVQAEVPAEERIPGRPANMLLGRSATSEGTGAARAGDNTLARAMRLEDYGLGISRAGDEVILRSGNVYISPAIAGALHPFKETGREVYTLLLDRVMTVNALTPILNYVIAAGITGKGDMGLRDDEAAVNQWAAEQLQLKVGDTVQVSPYRVEGDTVAVAGTAAFKVARIVPLTGVGADATLTPVFHGLTDAQTMAMWNPPAGFPFDRGRVTAADEAYWNEHKAAPKLFFNLIAAQRLVKPETTVTAAGDSGGELTSMRMPAGEAGNFERELLDRLTPEAVGFVQMPFAPEQAGSTDFGGLFLGLSGFLLIAALLLVVLLFRLAVEQRARQMGLLGALGFGPGRIGRMILGEGLVVAGAGAVLGVPAAVGYTRLLVGGLGTWWIGATGTTAIELHVHFWTVVMGGVVSLGAAVAALGWTARGMARGMPSGLLSGGHEDKETRRHGDKETRSWGGAGMVVGGMVVAMGPVMGAGVGWVGAAMGFLVSGFLLLALGIVVLARWPVGGRGVRRTLAGVAAAGIWRARTRAVLCVGLMAAAAFLLTSVTAFESVPGAGDMKPPSGTGGYQMMITTQMPLPADVGTAAGRKLLGVPEEAVFAGARFTALRVKAGDDISCLNMTRPTSATVVGVPAEVLQRLAVAKRGAGVTGAIGAAVDAQTAEYILHAGLGERVPEGAGGAIGRPIVIETLLADSIFQSYALVPEEDFRREFPGVTRASLILVDCPAGSVPELRRILRSSLDDFGVTVETTGERLAAYHAVADSYIAAFQFLGALALLVGTLGLVVVLARNVIQRRAELALLQALGFTRGRVTAMLVIEHGVLLLVGLGLGVATALLATLPQMGQVHVVPVAGAVGIIGVTGLVVLTTAARMAMRRLTPAALRQE